jgi:hypothetical protein
MIYIKIKCFMIGTTELVYDRYVLHSQTAPVV